ncbi:sulfite exporter TauE/SafE family protein, partial [Actinacidiphila rubida]|uniref:sulfite exporter TauE/SafE family protein n=1 Tax=Actinacidiphila rubida TaxID=310780 RepID=UPI000849D8C1
VTSATGLAAHARDGNVAWRTGVRFAAAGIIPAFLAGAATPARTANAAVSAACGRCAVAAVRMLRPAAAVARHGIRPEKAAAAGAGLGAVTGFLGVGGGFLAVPALVDVLGLRMRQAVGTSLLVINVNSLAALAARTGTGGDLRWAVIGPFAAAAVLAAWDGKRLAAKISGGTLQRIFAFVLLGVAVFMLADAFT